jgi:NADH:ubiquinone oxidoreductase subunit 2 (subunit N)
MRYSAILLLAGGLVVSIACLERRDRRPALYPLLAVMLRHLQHCGGHQQPRVLFSPGVITLSSYFLILRRREAAVHALRYFAVLAGGRVLFARRICADLRRHWSASRRDVARKGRRASRCLYCWRSDILIKAGGVGVHVWLPGSYAEAMIDVSALLSAIVSKASDVAC